MKVRVLAVVGILVCAVQVVRSQAEPADATPAPAPTSQIQQTHR